ncbi:hypothetical protein CPter291_2705 [Collimonas pratensis]|uniref:Uncharacterized protein n=1 Tax=Collimonas pratensis TaxID=279113 RepID=A0ABM5Z7G4_9BURK|nr:hypothetical protein CPter291_2705 [Collimonas pratensis]
MDLWLLANSEIIKHRTIGKSSATRDPMESKISEQWEEKTLQMSVFLLMV